MHTHPNARLTPLGRERLLRRHIDHAESLAFLAAQSGISVRTAYKWLARYRSGGASALVNRRSVRRTQRLTLDPLQLQHAVDLRHERCTLRRVARVLAAPLSTVGRVLKAIGLGRLKNLQHAEPVRRYQWARPGDMIHVDTKQLARFERVGHRITGDRRLGCSRGAGYEKAHVAIDDATRLAYVELLPDEKQATTVGFLLRAVAWFDAQGNRYAEACGYSCKRVLSDNGSAYRSRPWREACSALGLTPKRTRPYTPRTNGKAERYGLRPTSFTSRPCWLSGRTRWPFRPQPSESTGYRVIWRSITAAGVTWPWLAAPPFSSSDCCGLLNDLVRKHF